MQYSEFKCPACGLFISCDLDPDEMQHCCLCGYHRPQPVKIVEPTAVSLCSVCRDRSTKKRDEELEADLDDAFRLAGL